MNKKLFLAVFFILCSISVFAQDGTIITEVHVNGMVNVDNTIREQVYEVTNSLIGKTYETSTLRSAAASIYDTGTFIETPTFTSASDSDGTGLSVIFTVTEYPVVGSVIFNGNRSFTNEKLENMISTKSGEVISFKKVVEDAMSIRNEFLKNGYTESDVISYRIQATDTPNVSNVVFEIFEKIVGNVIISGNSRTRDSVLVNYIRFFTGQVYNENNRIATQNSLYRSGLFDLLQVVPASGEFPNTVDIYIVVLEAKSGSANIGATWNQEDSLSGYFSISDRNLFGTGHSLSFSVLIGGKENSYNFNYMNPFVDKSGTMASIGAADTTYVREIRMTTSTPKYEERRTGVSVTLSRPIDKKFTTRVYLEFRNDTIKGAKTSGTISPEDAVVLEEIMSPATVRALKGTITKDTRYPSSFKTLGGSLYTFSVEQAGMLGGVDYTKLTTETRQYIRLREDKKTDRNIEFPLDWIYAVRLRGGMSTGNIPYLDQFMLGGSESLRGYATDEFIGAYEVLLNQEIRIPLNKVFSGVLFLDIGDAWGGNYVDDGLAKSGMSLKYGYGIGARIDSPLGPLRFDYGFSDKKKSGIFSFGMGHAY